MRRLVLVALLTGACGGEESDSRQQPVTCAAPSGSYRVVRVAAPGGTCGAPAREDIIINFDTSAMVEKGETPSQCTGTVTPGDGRCSFSFDVTCALPGLNITRRGKVTWNEGATMGQAQEYRSQVGASTCNDTRDITYTKL